MSGDDRSDLCANPMRLIVRSGGPIEHQALQTTQRLPLCSQRVETRAP